MNDVTHSALPWVYKATAGNHDFAVYSEVGRGNDIALVRDFNEANAALIVRAVNSHEATINALECALMQLELVAQAIEEAVPDSQSWRDVAHGCAKQAQVVSDALTLVQGTQR